MNSDDEKDVLHPELVDLLLLVGEPETCPRTVIYKYREPLGSELQDSARNHTSLTGTPRKWLNRKRLYADFGANKTDLVVTFHVCVIVYVDMGPTELRN